VFGVGFRSNFILVRNSAAKRGNKREKLTGLIMGCKSLR
jgi:hypothetical protein